MKMENIVGKVVGTVLIAGATLAVCLWPKAERKAPPPEAVRPVKSVVVTDSLSVPDLSFAATVRAENRRVMVFKQSGRIQRIPVDNGTRVKKGDKLAWLDPSDYENKLAQAKADAEKDRLTYERRKNAFKLHGVSAEEVSQAEAAMKSAVAAVSIAELALKETVLYAPFDGVVAKVIAEEHDMVNIMTGLKEVLILQDDVNVKVDAIVPETVMIRWKQLKLRNSREEGNAYVTFDASPDKRHPVRFFEVEQTSEENDSKTYNVTFIMKKPDDLMIMPGMSATLTLPSCNYKLCSDVACDKIQVPEAAFGAADDGSHFVWVLEKTSDADVFVAKRRPVTCLKERGGRLVVTAGLKPGERVATSGVSLLSEGRKVSLMKDRTSK